MENDLKYENANLRFENAKLKFETLFNERPSTIRSFGFHGSLRIIYLVIGITVLIASLIFFGMAIAHLLLNIEFSDYLQREFHATKELAGRIADKVIPLEMEFSIALFVISICFLIMARLCRKIVRRNMYIMDLENTWMDLKQNN